jgi:hypothetical protein
LNALDHPMVSILLVGAASSWIQDEMAAGGLARIQQGISVVSMSIGSPESQSHTRMDSSLTTPADHTHYVRGVVG